MTIIGFDIGKNEIIGVLVNKAGMQKEVFCLANEKREILTFLREKNKQHKSLRIATEATGQYHRSLALCCLKLNIPCFVLNPIITKQFTKATVRKKKTDITDALAVARLGLRKEGSLATKEMFNPLKRIDRAGYRLGKMLQGLNLMKKELEETLPRERALTEKLNLISDRLKEAASFIAQRIDRDIDDSLKQLLCSIIGVGPQIARTLIVEIGNIERFPSGKELVAFSGLDPKVKQSSQTLKRNVRLTLRGSPFLRRSIFIAASIAQRHDEELKLYYEKKRKEGKTYREATCAVARKMLYRVYAVWKRKTPYVKRVAQTGLKHSLPQKVLT